MDLSPPFRKPALSEAKGARGQKVEFGGQEGNKANGGQKVKTEKKL
jgi:hypothetical protein